MSKKALLIAGLGLILPLHSSHGACRYTLEPGSLQVGWTAFKTTEKVAVKGSLTEVSLKPSAKEPRSFIGFLEGFRAEIVLASEKSSQSGNPARDQTLYQHFFGLLAKKGIRGRFVQAKGPKQGAKKERADADAVNPEISPEASGELSLLLSLNGRERKVPLRYSRTPEGMFSAKGTLDLLDFGAKQAFDSIHTACEVLHRGPDGVSKTWSEVEIEIAAKITGGCSS